MITIPEVDEYYAALRVITILQQARHEAYLVGGCVRDLLLDRTPHDWDVATSALPDQVTALFPHTTEVGKSFGVVPVVDQGIVTQVATFRKDGIYSDNRRPDTVEFCGLKEDVLRRDFTINGIAYDPLTGRVIDLVGGEEDLKNRTIRAIGNPVDRLREDLLRVLRAVRFSTVLNFHVEPGTATAVRGLAPEITTVAWERISEELRKILMDRHRSVGILKLDRYGLLEYILPEVSACKGVEQPAEFHPEGDVFVHTLLCLYNLPVGATFTQAMATLLHDIGKPSTYVMSDRIRFPGHAAVGEEMAREICLRLRLTNDETEEICWMVGEHMNLYVVGEMRKSRLRRFLSEPHFQSLLVLGRADALSSHGSTPSLEHLDLIERELEKYQAEPIRPTPLLRGQDLIDMSVPQGPIYGRVLRYVEDAQLEGTVTTREEALALAQQYLKENTYDS